MRTTLWSCALVLWLASKGHAQQPDTTTRRDSLAALDSAAADSIRLVRELERIQAEPRNRQPAAPATGGTTGPTNPRLLPDISAVGDLVGDLSPKRSTQEDGTRFGVREVEIAVQAAVDPYFRGDVFLGISDLEGVAIEQAYLTATALPYGLEARLGRFLMPVGKQNVTHRHDLHTIEYPLVIQRFFGPEGLKGTGIWLSKIFAPFGFYQELQLTAVDRFGEDAEDLVTERPVNRELNGLGFSGRFRNYFDLSEAANFEIAASAATGKRAQPVDVLAPGEFNATPARQSIVGADLTYRWRPLQQGLYKSFILQTEVMRQINQRDPSVPFGTVYAGPTRDFTGAYGFARYQLTRRLFLGGRYDWLQDPEKDGETLSAASGILEFFPSEFSKLAVSYERLLPSSAHEALMSQDELDGRNRILLQASFALGPHKPHPF
jgi:hypothetical protein